jgi:signal transduction histidine kinase
MPYQNARECPLAGALAQRLRASRDELTHHWLSRIAARVSMDPNRVFPTEDLLDHVPLLIDGIADYLAEPAAEVSMDSPVIGKAMELGALRHAQGFDAYQILKEYELLGGILFNYLSDIADQVPETCTRGELLACGQRVFRAIAIIQQTTTTHFLRLAQEQVADREERLGAFNRSLSHELKNRIGAVLGAAETMREVQEMSAAGREQFLEMIVRNARGMQNTMANIIELSRLERDTTQQRNVRLPAATREAVRQVREAALAARVQITVDDDLPDMEVNAAAVELCLTNYLSNAIKYRDPQRTDRSVWVSADHQPGAAGVGRIVIRVRDNGLGVPLEQRRQLFQRFFRAHETVTAEEGTGLGLSIVRDTAASVGGEAWAEFPEVGSVFAFSLPDRLSAEPAELGAGQAAIDGDGGVVEGP